METRIPIPFPFSLRANDNADISERAAFWDSPSTLEWFRHRGYALYARNQPPHGRIWYSEPALSCEDSGKMQYPYAYYGEEKSKENPLRASDFTASSFAYLFSNSLSYKQGKIAYAQETQDPSHHVAIKLIVTDSEEHRILRFLQSQGMKLLKENCLVPVLEILPNGPFSFVVMPRWNGTMHRPTGGPIRNAICIMHSLLKALIFLHKNNILHRDIKHANVLISHFADDATYYHYSSM